MKSLRPFYLAFLFALLPFTVAVTQEISSENLAPQAPLDSLLLSIGGQDALASLALVALLIQASMFTLRSKVGEKAGKYRLALLYALSIIGGVITLKLQGLDLVSALTHSNSMAAYQVFMHQVYKQFVEKSQEG